MSFPCGCTVEVGHLVFSCHVVECPWCKATFGDADFVEWSIPAAVMLEEAPKPLIKFGNILMEAMGHCHECRAPLARECGGARGGVVIHLAVPVSEIEYLPN